MQSSVAGEIRWRHTLYKNILAHCQQGRFTLARFIALVPNRLRLSVGESIAKMKIPVSLPETFIKEFTALMPPMGRLRLGGQPPWNNDQLRRAIRLAQIDSHLDPLTLGLWLAEQGDRFIGAVANLYAKALREVGQGEGGEETAYLVHLLLLRTLRLMLHDRQKEAVPRGHHALVCNLASMALEAALSTIGGQTLSARLGFQFAVAMSPPALGASPSDLGYFLNSYRTSNEALQLARGRLSGPIDAAPLDAVAQSVTEELLKRPAVKTSLAREALGEVIRDCLLLAILRLDGARAPELLKALQKVATSGAVLYEHLHHQETRAELIDCLTGAISANEPFKTLKRLLVEGDRAMMGNTELLGRHGDIRQRAEVAAAGAINYLYDEYLQKQLTEILDRLEIIPEGQQKSMYESGRCYQIDFSAQPFFLIPNHPDEAHLFVDVKDFTKRTASIKERSMGDFLRRYFYQPIFEFAAQLKAESANLSISNILGDAVAFHGDIRLIVPLALEIRKILSAAEHELQHGLADVLGGQDTSLEEIETELGRLRSELQRIASNDDASKRKRIESQIRMVQEAKEQKLARTIGLGLEAGAYISYGGAAETVDLAHPILGNWSVTIAERLNEAARGTARSAKVKRELDQALMAARLAARNSELEMPFRVRVGRSFQLELSDAAAELLSASLFSGDKTGITQSIKSLAQWLHQEASQSVDRGDTTVAALSQSAEFYNAGCALSGQALDAYERATARALTFDRIEVYRRQLSQNFLNTFLLEHDPERFVVIRNREGILVHLMRYTGQASFKGFEAQGGIDVWEILLPDAPFARALYQSVPGLHAKALA